MSKNLKELSFRFQRYYYFFKLWNIFDFFVPQTGFEPVTYCLEDNCSKSIELLGHFVHCQSKYNKKISFKTFLVSQTGFEPVTCCLGGYYSIHWVTETTQRYYFFFKVPKKSSLIFSYLWTKIHEDFSKKWIKTFWVLFMKISFLFFDIFISLFHQFQTTLTRDIWVIEGMCEDSL